MVKTPSETFVNQSSYITDLQPFSLNFRHNFMVLWTHGTKISISASCKNIQNYIILIIFPAIIQTTRSICTIQYEYVMTSRRSTSITTCHNLCIKSSYITVCWQGIHSITLTLRVGMPKKSAGPESTVRVTLQTSTHRLKVITKSVIISRRLPEWAKIQIYQIRNLRLNTS